MCKNNNEVIYFEYGEKELLFLKKKDKKLSNLIDKTGLIKREVTPNVFVALINSVIGQQISSKAAKTVCGRLLVLLGEITPTSITNTDVNDIQKCGLFMRKSEYLKNIAQSNIDFDTIDLLSDDEIMKVLCGLKGVGVWTVEMLLIFSLQRKDILSFGDLAIRNGIMELYGKKDLTKSEFEKYRKRYSPYGTIASLYLWEMSH